MRLAKAFFVSLSVAGICALVSAVGFPIAGPHFDKKAQAEAEAFCNSVAIGEPSASVKTRANASSIKLEEWSPRGNEVRYVAWFSGFLANASTCDITMNKGLVSSKFVEGHRW